MRVAFLGLGLIGGSIARALRAAEGGDRFAGASLVAWSPGGRGPAAALAAGIVDEAAPSVEQAVVGADLVILAAPPLEILDLFDRLGAVRAGIIGADTLVTDVASTKARICERAREVSVRFVGGHPMAGREASGFGAADPGLFRDRPWVVVADGAALEDVRRVEELARACGARPVLMDAASHDAAVAAISHLPLVAAAALVESVIGRAGRPDRDDWPAAAALAASGWDSTTRLARGDIAMGTGIAATNAAALAARLRAYRAAIDAWIEALERAGGPEPDDLAARFRAARERLGPGPTG